MQPLSEHQHPSAVTAITSIPFGDVSLQVYLDRSQGGGEGATRASKPDPRPRSSLRGPLLLPAGDADPTLHWAATTSL